MTMTETFNQETTMTSRHAFMGFLIGAAAGGLAGVLMAPDSGKATRKKVKKRSKRMVHNGEEKIESARTAIDEKTSEYTEAVKGILDDVSRGSRAHVGAVKDAAHEARSAYRKSLDSDS
jgi:gas vesicle protein